jgi:hypothetical protein
MREVARLVRPHTVIIGRAVNENDAWFGGIERFPAGVNKGRLLLDEEFHFCNFSTA